MNVFSRFFKHTVIGGLLFMVPLILMALVLQKALGAVRRIVAPIAEKFPVDRIAGVGIATVGAVLLIVVASFLFGLVVRTRPGRKVRDWLEYTILGGVPGYAIVKGVVQGATGLEKDKETSVALIRIEDAWQLGFVVEVHEDGHRTVYVPGAPNPASGSIFYMTEDRVRPLDVKMPAAVAAIRHLGVGSKDVLKGKLGA